MCQNPVGFFLHPSVRQITCFSLQGVLRCKMVTPCAEKCSKIQMIACLWIFMPGRDLTDLNHMENVDTVIYDGFLVGSSSQCWIAHPHLAQQKLPSSVCLWESVPCLCDWQCRITMKQTPKTDWSGFCLQQLKSQQRAVSSAAAQWITEKLPATEEWCSFPSFVLGCFLHSSFHLYLGFVTKLLEKKSKQWPRENRKLY